MKRKKGIDIEIDRLTNSIVNVISGEVFETEFNKISKKEISKKDWFFDWNKEMKDKENEVYKMTTIYYSRVGFIKTGRKFHFC